MEVPDGEGVAIHAVLESCIVRCETPNEALTEVRAGQPLSRDRVLIRDADVVMKAEGYTVERDMRAPNRSRAVKDPGMPARSLYREPGDLRPDQLRDGLVRIGKVRSRSR